jgi:hypothetical protein
VQQTPSEKSPGPDGFIGVFYKHSWGVVGDDVVAAIKEVFALREQCWNLLNSANVVLIAKKDGAQRIADNRPISVMHSIAKLLGKILANRLAPHLDGIISHSQSAL